jgi:hypothetical protein
VKVDGIWKVEILGPYGWEAVSTSFLENGRYLGASQDHYTIGQYEVSGDSIRVEAVMYPHSEAQNPAASGDAPRKFGFEGQIGGAHISGQVDDSSAQQSMTVRGTRLGDLP